MASAGSQTALPGLTSAGPRVQAAPITQPERGRRPHLDRYRSLLNPPTPRLEPVIQDELKPATATKTIDTTCVSLLPFTNLPVWHKLPARL